MKGEQHSPSAKRDDSVHDPIPSEGGLSPLETQSRQSADEAGDPARTCSGGEGGPVAPTALAAAVSGYEIVRELGRGGMGVVYLARQTSLNRLVALKMILTAEHAGPTERERFRTEAEAIARLQHPGIVQIHEVGEYQGLPFFSFEFCAGGSLEKRLAGTPLPAQEAAGLVEKLARAMQAAHDKGVIHRDLKPANVLLAEDGNPKITDFGLAKKLDEAGRTATGAVMGTPSYMAPEQARGRTKEIGPGADIYALGAILYECLTGRPPFKAPTPLDTIMQLLHNEPVPPRRLSPQIPRDLETICLKCLRKEIPRRYLRARDLADDLTRFLAGEPITARPVGLLERGWRTCRRHPSWAAVCFLGGLVLLGLLVVPLVLAAIKSRNAWELGQERDRTMNALRKAQQAERNALRTAADAMFDRAQQLSLGGEPAAGLLWFARGLDHAVQGGDGQLEMVFRYAIRAWAQQTASVETMMPHPGCVVRSLCWSPDGKTLATGGSDGTVRFWNVSSLRLQRPSARFSSAVLALAWQPRGKLIAAYCADGTVRLWPYDGSLQKAMVIRILANPVPDYFVPTVVFHPDGTQILASEIGATVWARNVTTGERIQPGFNHGGEYCEGVAYHPDGTRVLTANANWRAQLWDARTGKAVGRSILTANRNRYAAFDPAGSRFLTGHHIENSVQVWETSSLQPLGKKAILNGNVHAAHFSSDGRQLVVSGESRILGAWDWGTGRRVGLPVVTQDDTRTALLTPDGKQLVVGGTERVTWYRIDEPRPRWTHLLPAPGYCLSFRLDRPEVAISAFCQTVPEPTARQIFRYDLQTGKRVEPSLPFDPLGWVDDHQWSPDGKRVYGGCGTRVRIWDTASGKPIRDLEAGVTMGPIKKLALHPKGRILLGIGYEQRPRAMMWDVESGKALPTALQIEGTPHLWAVRYTPDGERILLATQSFFREWLADGKTPLGPVHAIPNLLVTNAAYRSNGQVVALAGSDGFIRQVDTAQGIRAAPSVESSGYYGLTYTPNGELLLASGLDFTTIWHASTGKPVGARRWGGHVKVSPDGSLFGVTPGNPERAEIWPVVTPIQGDPERVLQWIQSLTGLQLNTENIIAPIDPFRWRPAAEVLPRP